MCGSGSGSGSLKLKINKKNIEYKFMFFAKKKIGGFFIFTRIQPNKIVIKAKTVNYFLIFLFNIVLNQKVTINSNYSW